MNTADSNTIASGSEPWTSRIFSGEVGRRLIVLASLPICFLLGHLAISVWAGALFTGRAALLALVGVLTIARWRRIGLFVSTTVLVGTLAFIVSDLTPRFWYLLHASSLLLSWVVLYLTFEEIRAVRATFDEQLEGANRKLNATLTEQKQQEEKWREEREELQEALQRLKEEAEQRTHEMEQQFESYTLMRTEVDLLTAQKEEIVRNAAKIKAEAEAMFADIQQKGPEIERFMHEKEALQERCERAEKLQVEFEALREGQMALIDLQNEVKNLEEELTQLREENKTIQVLRGQLTELTRLKEEKARDQEMIELLKHNRDQVVVLTKQLSDQTERVRQLEQAKQKQVEVQTVVDPALQERLEAEITRRVTLEKELAELQVAYAETKSSIPMELKQELARAEGLYNQLRSQFAEKSRVLDQTRQQLFKTEGELELARLDRHNCELDGGDEDEEIHILVEGLKSLEEEAIRLTAEIEDLEGLIAHLTKEQ